MQVKGIQTVPNITIRLHEVQGMAVHAVVVKYAGCG